jgi:hypothetical protein
MIVKASERSALILAAGVVVLLATPVTAATDGDDSATDANKSTAAQVTHRTYRHVSHHRRHYAHRSLHTIAKADDDNKTPAADAVAADNKALATIPPQVANANAQMLFAGAQLSAAAAIPPGTDAASTASRSANAGNQTFMVAADQLNDVDRTLQESSSTAATAASPPPAPVPATTMTGESSVWDQTTLIGKIFIGFGALLTMASAARMFIT